MKLLSHSELPVTKPQKVKETDQQAKTSRKKLSKDEKEKQGRYIGVVILLLSIIAAAVLHFL